VGELGAAVPDPGGDRSAGITIGEFDGTGRPDIAVADKGDTTAGSNNVKIITNTGPNSAPVFTVAVTFTGSAQTTVSAPVGIASGRFRTASVDDLIVANSGRNEVIYMLNSPPLTFPLSCPVPIGPIPTSGDPEDFNHDGHLDFVCSNSGNNTVSVRLGDGQGNFTAPVTGGEFAVGPGAVQVLAVDLNQDDFPEIVTLNAGDATISVLRNQGAAVFSPQVQVPVEQPVSNQARSITALDLDQDGDRELAVAIGDHVAVLRNDHVGTQLAFSPGPTFTYGGRTPLLVVNGDVDLNSQIDLIAITSGGTDVPDYQTQVNPNRFCFHPACYANCDASVTPPVLNVQDFICFINRFHSGDPRANCDCSTALPILNVQDFTCFINAFTAGCP
jgi:hypothetical protein